MLLPLLSAWQAASQIESCLSQRKFGMNPLPQGVQDMATRFCRFMWLGSALCMTLSAGAAENKGLVVYCPFDGSLKSEAALEVTGKESGEIQYGDGVRGQALRLSKDTYVDLSAAGILPEKEGTIAFWIKPDWHATKDTSFPFRRHFLSRVPSDSGVFQLYYWHTPHSLVCSFDRSKRRGKHLLYSPPWRGLNWNHIAATWKAGESVRLYVNGLAGRQGGDVASPVIVAADTIRVGGEPRTTFYRSARRMVYPDTSLCGLIDELRIWGRCLSDEEVERSYRESLPEGLSEVRQKAKALPGGWVDVKAAYGAKGDGKADDTEALQRAFDSRESIFLPMGYYRITQTLRLQQNLRVQGEGSGVGGWNRTGQSVIVYDGPEGGAALLATATKHVQLRHFAIDGNKKAAIGLKWAYAYALHSMVQDVTVTGTLEHAIYLAVMGVMTFDHLHIFDNHGNGVTMGSYPNQDGFEAGVNGVYFRSCHLFHNGLADRYDGEENVREGYAIGFVGYICNVGVTDCVMEGNGGAGIYIGPTQKQGIQVSNCYFESNSQSVIRKIRATFGNDAFQKRGAQTKPVGRIVSILVDRRPEREARPEMSLITFDNITLNWSAGIWLRGSQPVGLPIQFRRVRRATAIYSEHGNWEWVDSQERYLGNMAKATGAVYKGSGQNFVRFSDEPSGHPAIRVNAGQRQVIPFDPKGITLYVDTDNGDDTNDGRTPGQAWASFAKVSRLFSGTALETPYTIEIKGKQPVAGISLRNMTGRAALRLRLGEGVILDKPEFVNLACRLLADGAESATLSSAWVDRCAAATFSGLNFAAPRDGAAVTVAGGSNAQFLDCRFAGEGNSGTGIRCVELSRIGVQGGTMRGFASSRGLVTSLGASVHTSKVENACGVSEEPAAPVQPREDPAVTKAD